MAILHDNLPRGLCNLLPMLALFACVAVGSPAYEPPFIVAVGISTACVAVCAQHRVECIILGLTTGNEFLMLLTTWWACWRWILSAVIATFLPVSPDVYVVAGGFYVVLGPVTAIAALISWLSYGGALSAAEAAKLNAAAPITTTSAPDLNTKTSSDSNESHGTYGTAIANVLHCVSLGIRTIDSAVAALGGCPYSPGATATSRPKTSSTRCTKELCEVGEWREEQQRKKSQAKL
ncbi:hypothetical protein JCM8202v2_002199 [Rhodotorula sphaerocarpa]